MYIARIKSIMSKILRYFIKHRTRTYFSFDFALSFHGLIPERAYMYTSAIESHAKTSRKKKRTGKYLYMDIPEEAFECGVNLIYEGEGQIRIASPEKALCDKLYMMGRVRNLREMGELLEYELRIDMEMLPNLNLNIIRKLSRLYPSENVKLLGEFIEKQRTCVRN